MRTLTARQLLVFGLLAGFVAGLLAFTVAHTIGEPPVNAAIAVEEAGAAHEHDAAAPAAHSHEEDAPIVSRSNQSTWGLLTATQVLGTTLGGLAGLVTALVVGRLGRLRPEACAALVAATGFLVAYAVPFAKYPPNPPAVGNPDTIGARTASYFGFIAISLVVAIGAAYAARALARRHGAFTGITAGVAGYAVVMLVVARLMPVHNEVPGDFPPDTLYQFRFAALATQLTLWAGIAAVLGLLLVRHQRQSLPTAQRAALQPA
ncbi:CbtA family protein [Luteipulveratus mongoliensis]|uniref:Cobalt transporter n=1 Tax=Luteipulveratus mongoliensis TaxID=571913 RepID=A0A0K1JM58_9MICO|nr:CbtA family protein [Luteipulveratus mongoliensis]AKU17794.1 hypothetical protein VV02_21280 [Luteipulveratus mongoliensis]